MVGGFQFPALCFAGLADTFPRKSLFGFAGNGSQMFAGCFWGSSPRCSPGDCPRLCLRYWDGPLVDEASNELDEPKGGFGRVPLLLRTKAKLLQVENAWKTPQWPDIARRVSGLQRCSSVAEVDLQ